MNGPRQPRLTLAVSMVIALLVSAVATGVIRADVAFEPSWKPLTYDAAREDVNRWLDEVDAPRDVVADVRKLWPAEAPEEAGGVELLDRLVDSFAKILPEAAELRAHCQTQYDGPTVPSAASLADVKAPALVRNNLRLYYGRWLAQYGLYDEVLEQLAELRPADVVDPASLLFYQMAAYHQLVRPDEARTALVQLLEHEDQLPRRFQQVAQLVSRDLAALEDESLDHIARRMSDIRRRLDHGRAGSQVQEIENGVVSSLDKKIKDLEKKCQQQASAAGGAPQSSKPMDDSRPAELKGAMQVDRRDIGHQSGWGDLPPKERQQALQQIGRDFPAHYRDLIEQYFRELANEQPVAAN